MLVIPKNSEKVIINDSHEEIVVEEGAELTYISLPSAPTRNGHSGQASQAVSKRATVGKNAKVRWLIRGEGSLQVHLAEEGAESQIRWIFSAEGEEKMNIYAENCYDAPNTKGQILMNGVVKDKAKVRVKGMIRITEKGKGTDSYMKQKALLLDKTAKINSIPSLEIRTDDVKAGHGAAISRVSPDDLFYLESRGIDKEESQKILIQGFLRELLLEFSDIPELTDKTHAFSF